MSAPPTPESGRPESIPPTVEMATTPAPRPGALWRLAIAAALLSGGITAVLHEATPTIFIPPPNMVSMMGQRLNQPKPADVAVADRKNAMLNFGVAGGLLAMFLGLAGGVARGSSRAALTGAVSGLVLGVAASAGAAAIGSTAYSREAQVDSTRVTREMTLPLLVHCGIWAAIGAAAGAGLGIGAGAGKRLAAIVLGGVLGGAIGAGLVDVVGSLIWPAGRTYEVIPGTWPPRILAAMLPPLLTALVVTGGILSPARRDRPIPAINPEA